MGRECGLWREDIRSPDKESRCRPIANIIKAGGEKEDRD